MTHTRQMADSEGDFSGWRLAQDTPCRKCGRRMVEYRVWESSDGAYEDDQYRCLYSDCGHVWWVDGIDS